MDRVAEKHDELAPEGGALPEGAGGALLGAHRNDARAVECSAASVQPCSRSARRAATAGNDSAMGQGDESAARVSSASPLIRKRAQDSVATRLGVWRLPSDAAARAPSQLTSAPARGARAPRAPPAGS
jgi:hypothetical protein